MIYVAHTESKAAPKRGSGEADNLTTPCAQLKSCMDLHPLAQAWAQNRSLVFGASIVRKIQSSNHLCPAGTAAANIVNRLWYGRALVSLRTYPQWSLRTSAVQHKMHASSDNGEICSATWANPVQ
ncbi:MAG TPA: hypothetical protein VIF60_05655 [Burkholderiaceae bacterium]